MLLKLISVFLMVDVLVLFVLLLTIYNSVSAVKVAVMFICDHEMKLRSDWDRVQCCTHPVTAAPEGAIVVALPKLAKWDISMGTQFHDNDLSADTYSTKEMMTPGQRTRVAQKRRGEPT